MTTPTIAGPGARFDLALSENPFAPLPSVLAALDGVMRRANRYPEFLPERLIAGHRGSRRARQPIRWWWAPAPPASRCRSCARVAGPGERIVFTAPDVRRVPDHGAHRGTRRGDRYRFSRTAGRIWPRWRPRSTTAPGSSSSAARTTPPARSSTTAELADFLRRVPDRVIVVLDEAYVEFVDRRQVLDVHRIIAEHPNVVFLRTFSKAYGLAGLRIGFGFADAALARTIRTLQLPFGMGSAAVPAVTASYAAEHELRARVAAIVAEREELWRTVRAAGIPVPRSQRQLPVPPRRGSR